MVHKKLGLSGGEKKQACASGEREAIFHKRFLRRSSLFAAIEAPREIGGVGIDHLDGPSACEVGDDGRPEDEIGGSVKDDVCRRGYSGQKQSTATDFRIPVARWRT